MSRMPSDEIIPIFASTRLKLHPQEYTIVSLSVGEKEKALEYFKTLGPFSSVTVDSKEVSLILREEDWSTISKHFPEHQVDGPYRAITFDIELDLSLVGYLSVVSLALANARISIYAISTYLRDHILVKSEDSEKAMQVLLELVEKCKSTIK